MTDWQSPYHIYKDISNSYLKFAADGLALIDKQNSDYTISVIETNASDYDHSKHLTNISWHFLTATYIAMYAVFESRFVSLTKKVENKIIPESRLKLKHITEHLGIMSKHATFLFITGVSASADQSKSPWDKMKAFKDVRDILVHNNGFIDIKNKDVKEYKHYSFLKKLDVNITWGDDIRIRKIKILEEFSKISIQLFKEVVLDIEAFVEKQNHQ